MTIDLGWGTLSGGTPANTLLGMRIQGEGAGDSLLNEPVLLQDGTDFQAQSPSKWTWKVRFWQGNFTDSSVGTISQTTLIKVAKFIQVQPKYIRLYSNLFTTLHPAGVWVQVFCPVKEFPLGRDANLYSIEIPLVENTPLDMTTF